MAKKMMKCYLYIRVSTQMQVDRYSLDAQRERLLKEARHRDMEVAAEFSDEGKSGKNVTGRPQFMEMMRRIRDGNPDHVSYVYVFKLSRFGRNTADVLNSLQVMEDCGVSLLAVEDGIDSAGAAGKLMIAVLAAVAEIERENIKTQVKAGQIQKAREGGWNGGPPPLGYRIEKDANGRNGRLAVEETEAKLVRLIFDKYAHTALGQAGVARWLNDHGYRRPVRQTGKYETFTDFAVKTILDNPVYTGKIVHGRFAAEKVPGSREEYRYVMQDKYDVYDGAHEAIISDELWEEVRAKRKAAAGKPVEHHGPKNVYLLSGIIRCPVCSQPMYGNVSHPKKRDGSGAKYPPVLYYICKHSRHASGRDCTYSRSIRCEALDRQVLDVVRQAMGGMYISKGLIQALGNKDELDEMTANLESLQAARKKIEQKRSRLLAKIAGLEPDDRYDATFDSLHGILRQHDQDIAELDDRIETVTIRLNTARNGAASFEQALRMFYQHMETIDDWPPEQQREIMHGYLEHVEIYPQPLPDGRMVRRIRFKFPVSLDGGLSYSREIDLEPDDDDTPPDGGPGGGSPSGDVPHLPDYQSPTEDEDFWNDDVLPNPNNKMMLLGRRRNRSTDSLQALALLPPSLEPNVLNGQ